jgi:hypothetical protein
VCKQRHLAHLYIQDHIFCSTTVNLRGTGRSRRNKVEKTKHRRTRSHPVNPGTGPGDRLDVSLLGSPSGDTSPEQGEKRGEKKEVSDEGKEGSEVHLRQ